MVSLAGASISGVATVLTKKYQKKLAKVTKLVDIVTLTISVFETGLSKALNNGEIDEEEFTKLQMFHLRGIKEQTNFDCKMEAETRNQFQKNLLEAMKDHKSGTS